jgi:hypothetical protein
MTLAPLPGSRGIRRLEVSDNRADERRRVVLVARDRVVIARSVAGVFMRIQLMPSAYRGILLRLVSLDDAGFHYEIHLAHQDPDLDVRLAQCEDEAEAHAEWDLWSRFFELPTLVERVEGASEPARPMIGEVVAGEPGPRRRGSGLGSRRARFLTRRKVGRPELCLRVDSERELFAGSQP